MIWKYHSNDLQTSETSDIRNIYTFLLNGLFILGYFWGLLNPRNNLEKAGLNIWSLVKQMTINTWLAYIINIYSNKSVI